MGLSGLSVSRPMANFTELVVRTVLSSCGKLAGSPTGFGGRLQILIIVTVYSRTHEILEFPFSIGGSCLFMIGCGFICFFKCILRFK
jgi:hypothetical protein